MANIYFKHISIHNFMSYIDAELNLDRSGNVLVGGINNNPEDNAKSNGCGKSSLFSALSWCLTGETVSGAKDVSNIYTEGKTEVSVVFDFDKNEYRITRTKNPSNLFIYINGENKSGKGIRDTSELLIKYIPQLSSSLINSVIILGQGLPQKFSNNTPSGRKEILEKLSNSDFMISDLKERLNLRYSNIIDEQRKIQDSNLTLDTEIRVNLDEINNLTVELENIEDKTSLIKEKETLEQELEDLCDNINDYNDTIEELKLFIDDTTNKRNSITKDYIDGLNSLDLVDVSTDEASLSSLNVEIKLLQDKITEVDSITDVCPTCGQKLPITNKIDTTNLKLSLNKKINDRNLILEDINTKKIKNDSIKLEYENKFKDKLTELDNLISINNSDLKTQEYNVKSYIDKKTVCSNRLKDIEYKLFYIDNEKYLKENKIAKLKVNNKILNEQLVTHNEQLDIISERLKIISKMQTLIKRDFRGYLLNNVIKFIEDKVKIYSLEVFGTDKVSFKLNNNNIDISYDGKDYSVLSGGEKQKLDIIIQFAIRDMLCTFLNFSSNILILDEITDSLDSIGVNSIFNLINSNLSDVEVVYIISHHVDELEIPADDEIIIIKGDDKISRIV